MAEPHRFGEAMNYAFVSDVSCRSSILPDQGFHSKAFATTVYALIGTAGYLMFGNDVYDEVTSLSFFYSSSYLTREHLGQPELA
jgi:hypothetical protein